jgi:hypothetical protein
VNKLIFTNVVFDFSKPSERDKPLEAGHYTAGNMMHATSIITQKHRPNSDTKIKERLWLHMLNGQLSTT